MAKYGKPEIFNTDQGSQFTGMDFTGALLEAGIQIAAAALAGDGCGYVDNARALPTDPQQQTQPLAA